MYKHLRFYNKQELEEIYNLPCHISIGSKGKTKNLLRFQVEDIYYFNSILYLLTT